jgi:hypothetical protein
MTAIDYYPLFNSGQTIIAAGKQDKRRVYGPPDLYFTRDIYVISEFEIADQKCTWDGEFILFQIDTRIDYAVITSLN